MARKISQLRTEAEAMIKEWKPLSDLKQLLRNCAHLAEVVNLRDGRGYTLIQHAIIHNRPNFVQFLVTVGAELNAPVCGRPLHLAAKMGHVEILKILLDYNADPQVLGCVCYPSDHQEYKEVFNPETSQWSLQCCGDVHSQENALRVHFDYPLYYAICSNSLDAVKLLIGHGACQLNIACHPLHLACLHGAYQCMEYFVQKHPNVNVIDKKGYYPIHYAVRWGKRFSAFLVIHGANVLEKTPHDETLLHLLFRDTQSVKDLSECLKYLLNCGLHLSINAVNNVGNSALNILMKLVHRQNSISSNSAIDITYNEVVKSVQLLLSKGANPNISNKVGDTSLHLLTRVRAPGGSDSTNGQVARVNWPLFHEVLKLLLGKPGINVNQANHTEGTPLSFLVCYGTDSLFASVTPQGMSSEEDVDYFISCLKLLRTKGCVFGSSWYQSQTGCLIHTTLTHLNQLDRLESWDLDTEDKAKIATALVSAMLNVVSTLTACGCLPNWCRAPQTDLHIMYYKLMAKSHLVPARLVQEFIVLFLQNGTDPNVGAKHIPMSVFRLSSRNYWPVYPLLHAMNTIASGDSSYSQGELVAIVKVFYNAMDEANARQCILHYLEHDRFRGRMPKCPELDVFAESLMNTPRKLKHMCANILYTRLGRQASQVDKLPLPPVLCRYIYNFNY